MIEHELEQHYGANNYNPLPVTLAQGQGAYVWDINGKRYLDMVAAYSAINHGHCHPRLVCAMKQQAETLSIASRAFYNEKLGAFLKKLCEFTGYDKALPMNTGAEAVETAIKAARKWGYEIKGIPENQAEIIVCENNFHGRTTSLISFSTNALAYTHYGPFTPGFKIIPYGDADALEQAITPNTAAFLVEPIQGEGGIVIPPEGYLKACSKICHNHHVLLLCDEIQTGLGRTGRLFAHQHEGIHPDGLMLGKALGGGLLPVSSFLSNEEVMSVFKPGTHGSTFGGNPLAAAVGSEAIDCLLEEQLTERSRELGASFKARLQNINHPIIKEIRGRGLFIGIELTIEARPVCEALIEAGVLCKDTKAHVIRLSPPLVVSEKDLAWAADKIEETLASW